MSCMIAPLDTPPRYFTNSRTRDACYEAFVVQLVGFVVNPLTDEYMLELCATSCLLMETIER